MNQASTILVSGAWVAPGNTSCGYDSSEAIDNSLLFLDGTYLSCNLVASYSSEIMLSSMNQAWTTLVSGAWVGELGLSIEIIVSWSTCR